VPFIDEQIEEQTVEIVEPANNELVLSIENAVSSIPPLGSAGLKTVSIIPAEPIGDAVEIFEEPSDDDVQKFTKTQTAGPAFTFETPHRGTDMNAIAKKIEFSKQPIIEEDEGDDFDFDIDVSSPILTNHLHNILANAEGQTSEEQSADQTEDTDHSEATAQNNDAEHHEDTEQNNDTDQSEDTELPEDGEDKKKHQASYEAQTHNGNALKSFSGSLQYQIFSSNSGGELEFLEEAGESENEKPILQERGGVTYIDATALKDAETGNEKIDQTMKLRVDSVLGTTNTM
jgi:hypothetical protein